MSNKTTTGLPAGIERDSKGHVEWLLRRRVKVVNTWPGMPNWYVADETIIDTKNITIFFHEGEAFKMSILEAIANYPHLFRPLEWWENREPEQMPGYVKRKDGKKVFKVKSAAEFVGGPGFFLYDIDGKSTGNGHCAFYLLPATRQEYEEFVTAGDGTKQQQ